MQKHIIFGIGGLVIGLAVGFFASNTINRTPGSLPADTTPAAAEAPFAGQQMPQGDIPAGGMMPDVAEKLEKAKNEPGNFVAQMEAGQMYSQIGRNDKALEYLVKGAELKPDDFQANVAVANAYFDTKQFENAEKYYSKALQLNPRDVNARTDLGTTFIERSNPDFDKGISEFEESLKIDPKHEPTLYNLGVAYFRRGDLVKAGEMLDRLEKADPGSPLAAKLRQNISPAKPTQ